jgi:D-alanyl-D-alanine carboxypeptidase/D-alanyl-D-alanine-endopeptidase (penicillin-binding protein 4)
MLFAAALPGAQQVEPPTTLAGLRERLTAHVGAPRFAESLWGVKIVSLDTGRTWFEHAAHRPLSPASNSKLYTGALALDRLGGDFRIVTPLLATAQPAGGELRGDLIVAGRGDPSWKTRGMKKDFWATFEPFVGAVERAGVKRITGGVVADATFLRGPPQGAGWTADDLEEDYGAEISAVSLEDNFADLRVTPGATVGAPCTIEIVQPLTGLVIDNRTTTAPAGTARQLVRRRLIGENVVHVFGTMPLGAPAELLDVSVPKPAAWFAAALTEALKRRGIRVDGAPQSRRWPDAPAAGAVTIGEVASPPLRELVAAFMKPSQNLETDLVFGLLGEKFRAADAPAFRSAEESAVRVLQDFLRANQLPAAEVRFEEGSGLSRNNLTTVNATVALLQFMATHRAAKDWLDSLPIAGVDGSLRRRMKGTPAEGNVRAKTGTLRYANSLAGYVTTAAGERLAFAFMLNRHVGASPEHGARDDLDELAILLAGFTGRADAKQ